MAAFRRALQYRVDLIELDIHFSRDRRIVIIHDDSVNRTTNGRGAVAAMDFLELRELDAGSWFHPQFANERLPTLDEVIDLVEPTATDLLIEIKNGPILPDGFENLLLDIVEKRQMRERIIFVSFDREAIIRIKGVEPSASTGLIVGRSGGNPARSAKDACAQLLALRWNLVNRKVIKEAHQHDIRVFVWTVNERKIFDKMVELGVDGIVTNYPGQHR